MKRLLLGLAVCLQTVYCFGQITLEKNLGQSNREFNVFDLENIGSKYTLVKPVLDDKFTVDIYNPDHSLYKSFISPVFTGLTGYGLKILSTKLVNSDDKIEFILHLYFSNQLAGSINGSRTLIINEDGNIIFQRDSSLLSNYYGNLANNYPTGIYNLDGKYKMIVSSTKKSDVINGSAVSIIYAFPGSLPAPTALNDEKLLNQDKASLSLPMPNPSSETTRIEFQLPAETNMGEITVYNSIGLRVKSYKIDNAFGDLLLNNSDLSSGNYTYQLVAGGKRIGSQKMMVIK